MIHVLYLLSDGGKMARNLYANPLEVFVAWNLCGPIIIGVSHCAPPYKFVDFPCTEYWNYVN
jgi:hypothetical protein